MWWEMRIFAECYADVWVECGAAGSDKNGVDNHDLGALVVSGGAGVEGNVNVGGNVGITENVFVGGKMDIMGNVDICGNVFCSSEPRFPSELTNKKYVDSLNRGSYGYYWKREYYRSYRFYVAQQVRWLYMADGRGGYYM
jgi:hypothetical protein